MAEAAPAAGAALDALPDDASGAFERFWSDETASGFTLTGNEYELALAVLAFLWATSGPGSSPAR